MGRKVTRKDIIGVAGPQFLFNDLSMGLLFTEGASEQLDGFFREFFAFIFNSELSGDREPLIKIQMDEVWTREEFADSVVMTHSVHDNYIFYQIGYKQIRCEVWWNAFTAGRYTDMFAAGFAAYALKNNIEIQNSSFTNVAKCYDYFPAVAWLRENRSHKDYDNILGKLYDYVTSENCLDELLDFYGALDDMEGKAEFLNYCGRRGQFEQAELRL